MANVYGSSLDSMMQNEAAQQASAQNEANSYRNFLNNSANTNLRRREGDSLDRYRSGDIDVRRLDTTGMNDYRRGMITNHNTRIGSQERLGMDANRVSQANVDRNARAQEYGSDNIYNLGLDTNETSSRNVGRQYDSVDRASANQLKLGLNTNETSAGNVKRQYDSADYASGNQLALGTLQTNNAYTQAMDANRTLRENAALPYDRLNARDQAIVKEYGATGLRPPNENLALLNASAANERAASDRTAYQNLLSEIDNQYKSDNTGFFSGVNPNNDSSTAVQNEMDLLASQRDLKTNNQKSTVYNEALGNVARKMSAARNPGFNPTGNASALTPLPDPMGGTNRPAPLTRKTKGGVSYQVN